MSRDVIVVRGQPIVVSRETTPIAGGRLQSLLQAQLQDELTGEPPQSAVQVTTPLPGATPRVGPDGIVGLVGIPQRVFRHLELHNATFIVTIEADGYLPITRTVTIGPEPGFPGSFAPVDLGVLPLHRRSILVHGRVVLKSGTGAPIAGAHVAITGIWRTLPPANLAVLPETPHLVALQPPLFESRQKVTDHLRRREITLVAGSDKTILAQALIGQKTLLLSDAVGLLPGDVVQLDAGDPETEEIGIIASVPALVAANQAASVTLRESLARTHPRGVSLQKAVLQAPGTDNAFAQEAILGDETVFLNHLTDLGGAQRIEIAPAPLEYHRVRMFTVLTDGNGYYRLPPLSRVAQLELQADDGGAHTPVTQTFCPDYTQPENRLDFSL